MVGNTTSSKIFQTSSSMYNYSGSKDGLVIALHKSDLSLAWYSYLGGSFLDYIYGVALTEDRIYLTGSTFSENFPTKNAVMTKKKATDMSIFLTIFSLDGAVELSTYVGAGMWSEGFNITIGPDNYIYLCGKSKNYNESFELTHWYTNESHPAISKAIPTGYVMKLDTLGQPIWTTGLSWTNLDALCITDTGRVYATGWGLRSFPITDNALQQDVKGDEDPVLVVLSPNGELYFSTWYDGHEDESFLERAWSIAVNQKNHQIIIVGATTAVDFLTEQPLQTDKHCSQKVDTQKEI